MTEGKTNQGVLIATTDKLCVPSTILQRLIHIFGMYWETQKEAGEMFRLSYRIKKKNNGPYEADSNQTACDDKMFLLYRVVSRAFICDHSNYADLFQNQMDNKIILPPFLNICLFRDFKWTTMHGCI